MSLFPENPYQPPLQESLTEPRADELASRSSRLVAAILDGVLVLLVIMPLQFLSGYIERVQANQATTLEQLGMSLVGLLTFLVFNGFLLANRGQTIGKAALGIQITQVGTGRLMPFVNVYVFRYLWTLPLVIVVLLIPGQLDNLLINIVVLVDILLIFREDRRCLHDLIAGTEVVRFQENRLKVASETQYQF